jgi:signal peptidase I
MSSDRIQDEDQAPPLEVWAGTESVTSEGREPAPSPLSTGEGTRLTGRLGQGFAGSVQSLSVTVVIAIFVITFVVQAFQIPSESMQNTLLIGDYLLVDKVHFSSRGPWSWLLPYREVKRGEVVVFRYPVHPSQHFVKRVIAVPGDRVRLVNKQAWVNGRPVDESYAVFHSSASDSYRDNFPRGELPAQVHTRWWEGLQRNVRAGELYVPPGHYFVLGDNRDESLDSRYWGFVPEENIVGRPLLIYFSVGAPDLAFSEAEAATDRLVRFGQAVNHVFREIRWRRTLMLVK